MTSIEWTHRPGTNGETWNPMVGCSIVSPGCTHCYAMRMAARIEAINAATGTPTHYAGTTRKVNGNAVWTGKVALAPENILTAPLRWKSPRTVFVNSMSDLFAENVPDEWILDVFTVMAIADQHTFQVLTKRPDRAREFLQRADLLDDIYGNWYSFTGTPAEVYSWPLHNVWMGASAEDQTRYDNRRWHLDETPAALRFWSLEPLLGPIVLKVDHVKPDWIIVGGESGPKARPMHPDWARQLRDQCAAAGVAFFFKQWGEWLPGENRMLQRPVEPATWQDGEVGRHSLARDDREYPEWRHYDKQGEPGAFGLRVGKKRAGRKLDGIEHSEFPS